MKNSLLTLVITGGILIMICVKANSQTTDLPPDASDYPYWIEMMQDPNANYFTTVEAFNLYWADRPDRKGKGYNPFKRWEWLMQFKINEDGSKRVNGEDRTEFLKYISSHSIESNTNGDWVNLGPIDLPASPYEFWGNGRLNAIAFHPTDEEIIYVGAPSGGLWVTTDGGQSWDILTDDQPTLGVSSVIVDYSDPNTLYIGSGDRDAGDAEGLGVFKSTDGGATWTQINNSMGNATVGRMLQHPSLPDEITAATSNGIYISLDGGNIWQLKQTGNFKDIVYKPGDHNTVYAAKGGRFYLSNDGGNTWSEITSGLPNGAYRGVIAVSDADPEYVYFLTSTYSAFLGMYRSTDAGQNFTLMSDSPNLLGWNCNGGSGGQAWYDLDVAADPLNENIVYVGGINCWKSTDGGVNWFMVSNQIGDCGAWPVHADLHVLEWSPLNGYLYAGNDGGIWYTMTGGSSWTRITNGLAIGQQYKLGQSKLLSYHTITGYQDNGISTYHRDEWIQTDMYADGMEAAMDNSDTTLSYGCMQYGRMYRFVNDKVENLIAGQGIGGITESGAWVTPFAQHEYDQDVMFIGYSNLWRTKNLTNPFPTWENITGGMGGTMRVVEHSPADPNIFYFLNSNGLTYRSDNIMDDSPSYIDLSSFLPANGAATDLEAHPTDPNVLYMTLARHVYKSEDKGHSWDDISGTLPDVSINDIAYYNRGSHDALYVATNIGVFFRDNTMDDWIMFSNGLPAAILATEVEIYHDALDQEKDMIRIASFGRGTWESPPYYDNPSVDFEASDTNPSAGCGIDFTDLTTGYPMNWEWTFEGGIPATSSEQDPGNVVYLTPGTYFVKLVASNPSGSDSLTKTAYITVGEAVAPTAEFEADNVITCPNSAVAFTDLSEDCPTAWDWSFDPPTVQFVEGTSNESQHPVVEFTQAGEYDVTLTVSNDNGSNILTKENYIQAGGYDFPFFEDFTEFALGDMEWYVENPDGQNTWNIHHIEWEDNYAMKMENWGYFNQEERDRLVSPPVNIGEGLLIGLHFDHAYAQRSFMVDSLIVYISGDCGTTWSRIYANGPDGSGIFATSPNTGYPFEPASEEDWCSYGYGAGCISIPLGNLGVDGTVRFMFENYNGFGNNLYIDNVLVDITESIDDMDAEASNILVFPNPSQGSFTLLFDDPHDSGRINIYDLMGRNVYQSDLVPGQIQYELNIDNKGIFVVEVIADGLSERVKVIVR